MRSLRSSFAKRKGTGRKARHRRIVKTHVVTHRHRRFAGIRHGNSGLRHPAKGGTSRATIRKRRFKGRKPSTKPRARRGMGKPRVHSPLGRHAKRHFKGRKKSTHKRRYTHKRVVRKGLHRHFKGRKKSTHKRVVRKGLHRHYKGRRKSTHKIVRRRTQKAGAAISAANYINMF